MTEKLKSRLFYGYVVMAAGFWIWFISFGLHGTFSIFFVPVSGEFGWTRSDTALASSLNAVMMGVLGLLMGWLTDKLGPRFVVTFFGSFLGIGLLLLSMITKLWQFTFIHALIICIGTSTSSVPVMSTISRWFTKRRSLMSGIVQSGVGVGGFVISPLAGWLIAAHGWRNAYVVLGIVGLLGVIISGLFLRRDPHEMGLQPDGVDNTASPMPTPKPGSGAGLALGNLFASRQFWILAGLYFAFGFCRSTFTVHVAPHVQDLGFSLAVAAGVVAIINISSILGRIGMGYVADRVGVRLAMIISYGATVVDMIWGLITRDLWGIYLYALVFGFGWGAQAVLRYPATAEVFGLRSAGLIMGILSVAENVIGAGIGVWIAGYIFDIVGNYSLIYWIGLFISIGGVVLAGMIKPSAGKIEASQPALTR